MSKCKYNFLTKSNKKLSKKILKKVMELRNFN